MLAYLKKFLNLGINGKGILTIQHLPIDFKLGDNMKMKTSLVRHQKPMLNRDLSTTKTVLHEQHFFIRETNPH